MGIVKTTLHSWLTNGRDVLDFFSASGGSYEYDPDDVATDKESRDDCTEEQNKILDKWESDYLTNPKKWQ